MSTATKVRYYSPTRTVTADVDVSLDEFSDSDITREYEHRITKRHEKPTALHQSTESEPVEVPEDSLRRVRTLLLCGQSKAAIEAMHDLIRDALGTAL